jgi:hypothetical protein
VVGGLRSLLLLAYWWQNIASFPRSSTNRTAEPPPLVQARLTLWYSAEPSAALRRAFYFLTHFCCTPFQLLLVVKYIIPDMRPLSAPLFVEPTNAGCLSSPAAEPSNIQALSRGIPNHSGARYGFESLLGLLV